MKETASALQVPWDGYQPLDIKDKMVAGERPKSPPTMPHACEGLLRKAWHQSAVLRPKLEPVVVDSLRRIEDALPSGATLGFSKGFVDSLDDFASLGTKPTGPSRQHSQGGAPAPGATSRQGLLGATI